MHKFKLIDSDYDFKAYERVLIGRVTYARYKKLDRIARKNTTSPHCGCEHDCCGCVCGRGMKVEVLPTGFKITYNESFNY